MTENSGSQLPTMEAGTQLLKGNFEYLLPASFLFLTRAAAIAAGSRLAGGGLSGKKLWKSALSGSASVQLFLLAYAGLSKPDSRLPSSQSAEALVRGEPGSLPRVGLHWLGRSALVGLGLWASGERNKVVRQSLGGAAAIELMILFWALQQKEKAKWQSQQ